MPSSSASDPFAAARARLEGGAPVASGSSAKKSKGPAKGGLLNTIGAAIPKPLKTAAGYSGSVVMKGLSALDTGRAAVVSGVGAGLDTLYSSGPGKKIASAPGLHIGSDGVHLTKGDKGAAKKYTDAYDKAGGFKRGVKEHRGFGALVEASTGSDGGFGFKKGSSADIWTKRALGGAGDWGGDPLAKAMPGVGESSKTVANAAREAKVGVTEAKAAVSAARNAQTGVRAAKAGVKDAKKIAKIASKPTEGLGRKEIARKVGSLGPEYEKHANQILAGNWHKVPDAVLEKAGLKAGVNIHGYGVVGGKTASKVARTLHAVGPARAGLAVNEKVKSTDLGAQVATKLDKLNGGSGIIEKAQGKYDALKLADQKQLADHEGRAMTAERERAFREAVGPDGLKEIKKKKLDISLFEDPNSAASPELKAKAKAWQDAQRQILKDKQGEVGYRENYARREFTNKGKKAIIKDDRLKEYDFGVGPQTISATQRRTLVPGADFLGQKLETGSAAEINRIARENGLPQIYDTSLARSVAAGARQVGEATKVGNFGKRLVDAGLAKENIAVANPAKASAQEALAALKSQKADAVIRNADRQGLTAERRAAYDASKAERKALQNKMRGSANDLRTQAEGLSPVSAEGIVPNAPVAAADASKGIVGGVLPKSATRASADATAAANEAAYVQSEGQRIVKKLADGEQLTASEKSFANRNIDPNTLKVKATVPEPSPINAAPAKTFGTDAEIANPVETLRTQAQASLDRAGTAKGAAAEVERQKADLLSAAAEHEQTARELAKQGKTEEAVMRKQLSEAAQTKATLADISAKTASADKAYGKIPDQVWLSEIEKGLSKYGKMAGGHDLLVQADMRQALGKIRELEIMRPNVLMKQFDKVMGVWKAQQLLTPGFHIRNAMGGLFNNYLAGVDSSIYPMFEKNMWRLNHGGVDSIPNPKIREAFRTMLDNGTIHADNAGVQIGEISADLGRASNRAVSRINPFSNHFVPFEKSRDVGNAVENRLRGSLYLDSMLKGMSPDHAFHRVIRFHYDGQNLSAGDRSMKRLVPFFGFTRNNLPLQLEMISRNPAAYNKFTTVKRNVEAYQEKDPNPPGYMKNAYGVIQAPFKVGGNFVHLQPDLIWRDLDSIKNPGAAMSYVLRSSNPVIQQAYEQLTGKRVSNGFRLDQSKPVVVHGATKFLGEKLFGKKPDGTLTRAQYEFIKRVIPFLKYDKSLGYGPKGEIGKFGGVMSQGFGVAATVNDPETQRLTTKYANKAGNGKKAGTATGTADPFAAARKRLG